MAQLPREHAPGVILYVLVRDIQQALRRYGGRERLPHLMRHDAEFAVALPGDAHHFAGRRVPDLGVWRSDEVRLTNTGLEHAPSGERLLGHAVCVVDRARNQPARRLEFVPQTRHHSLEISARVRHKGEFSSPADSAVQ
jgi:hypothetical protein